MSVDIAIRARGLRRSFGAVQAVAGIDLTIPAGCIYGFLGPNGSGKSTTIRMLCGLLRPDAGLADVLGLAIPRQAEQLRQRIGYMTQRFSLYEDLSVMENLAFIASIYGLTGETRKTRLRDQIDCYRLGPHGKRLAGTLSGGERQRLALACATLHEPELLFLDEPTSAVDPESRRDFWTHLFDLVDHGATILVSTHFMDEAERCHRLAILDRGRMVAEGEPLQLTRDIPANVVEVRDTDTRHAREILLTASGVLHIAQLGTRLHVLVDQDLADAPSAVHQCLRQAGIAAACSSITANLEDVFVMATHMHGTRR